MLLEIIIATVLISLLSLVGILVTHKRIKKFMHYFISFAAGTLIAVAFFDLMPRALEELEAYGVHMREAAAFIVAGILIFFLLERFIHWHHCGKEDCHERPAGLLILTGDFVHNFFDGLLIAGAFMLDFATGIITTISVAIHEIPQEFGDFAVLIHSGFTTRKALLMNLLSALSAVLGGVIGFFLFDSVTRYAPYAVLITAGGFLYVALTDIVPTLHRHKNNRVIVTVESMIFILSVIGMYWFFGMLH